MAELLKAQKRVLAFIHTGSAIPALREIAAKLGFRRHRGAFHPDLLKRKGFIQSATCKARPFVSLPPGEFQPGFPMTAINH